MPHRPLPPDDPYLEEDLLDGWTVRSGRRTRPAAKKPQTNEPSLFGSEDDAADAKGAAGVYRDEPIPYPPAGSGWTLPPERDSRLAAASILSSGGFSTRGLKLKKFFRHMKALESSDFPPLEAEPKTRPIYLSAPIYDDLYPDELRWYFGRRTAFRSGRALADGSGRCAWLYTLLGEELVNGIGWRDAAEGWRQLKRLRDECGGAESSGPAYAARSRLETWLGDFAVYYGLPEAMLRETLSLKLILDARDLLALSPDSPEEKKLALAASLLDYAARISDIAEDAYYQAEADDFRAVFGEALARLGATPQGAYIRRSLCMAAPGEAPTYVWTPFANCPFSDPKGAQYAREGYVYDIPGAFSYRAAAGFRSAAAWRVQRRSAGIDRTLLTLLLRRLSEKLRTARGFRYRLRRQRATPFDEAIAAAIAAVDAHRAALANPARSIDFSSLARIRADAAETQAKLIVDESPDEETLDAAKGGATPQAPSAVAAQTPQAAELDKPEKPPQSPTEASAGAAPADAPAAALTLPPALLALLVGILEGKRGADAAALVKATGLSPAMAVDAVNEALYDEIGDAALELSPSGEPQAIEDYEEDLRALCGLDA